MFNNEVSKLTIEQLRSFEGFNDISKDEAIKIIETLYQLSVIAYEKITIELNLQNE